MKYKLYLDDIRNPEDNSWVICRSSIQALNYIKNYGQPYFISFDHDLGEQDTTMEFLKCLVDIIEQPTFDYVVHSANPVGAQNIISYIESWKRSLAAI